MWSKLTKNVYLGKHTIDDWLNFLSNEMMRTLKAHSKPFTEFVDQCSGQIFLLDIQVKWTSDVRDALSKKHDPKAL